MYNYGSKVDPVCYDGVLPHYFGVRKLLTLYHTTETRCGTGGLTKGASCY